MHKTKPSRGFAHLGLVIGIVTVVAAIAFGGWYVWDRNKDDNNSNTQNNQNQESSDSSEGGRYLVIAEWGVRFALPEDLRGDIYYRVDNNDLLKTEFASFASKRLDNLLGDDSCTFKNNPQNNGLSARLIRGRPEQLNSSPQAIKDQRGFINTVDPYDYYYAKTLESPPITCLTGTDHEDLNEVEQSITSQLDVAFKSLEPIEQ